MCVTKDGSQRAFFPNGFAIYIFAEALLNRNCDYEKVREDYFSHIYGYQLEEELHYLEDISEAFDFAYMEGENSADIAKGEYYNPAQVENLKKVKEIAARGRRLDFAIWIIILILILMAGPKPFLRNGDLISTT